MTVELTRSDIAAMNTSLFFSSRSTLFAWLVYFVLVAALVWFVDRSDPFDWEILASSSALGATGALLIYFAASLATHLYRLKRTHGVLGPHTFTFSPEGLIEETSANQNLMKWGALNGVRRNEERILLEVQPGRYHYLPRRAFHSREHYDSFWQEAQRLAATDA
ncbi:MAG: YcxB family protein [Usitatibacter sp.]